MTPTEDAGSRPATVTIRSLVSSLAPAERRVAEVVLAAPGEVAPLSIGALAERASTSEATVVRFCRNVGFDGYPDLRLALAADDAGRFGADSKFVLVPGDQEISADEDLAGVVDKVGRAEASAITDTVAGLDLDALQQAVDAVTDASSSEIYGVGASGLVALDLEHKLRRIHRQAKASTDRHAALTSAALLGIGDVAIGISHGGETADVVDPISLANEGGATTIAVTNRQRSTLSATADIVLLAGARRSPFSSGATTSRVAQLIIIDCLFIAVALRDYDGTIGALDRTLSAVQRTRTRRRRR